MRPGPWGHGLVKCCVPPVWEEGLSCLLNTSIGRWWPRRSDTSGFWLDRSLEIGLRLSGGQTAGAGRGGSGCPGFAGGAAPHRRL
eukprot:2391316-Amphidinium_carterae.1